VKLQWLLRGNVDRIERSEIGGFFLVTSGDPAMTIRRLPGIRPSRAASGYIPDFASLNPAGGCD
jgi:hypothetical protein